MFGIGGWEFVLIAVLALLLFGPDKLPQFARTIGRFMRDFKRYQALMESTIRAEVFAADPDLKKDVFETGKEFRKKVAGGGFSKPETADAKSETENAEAVTEAEKPVTADEAAAVTGTDQPQTSEPPSDAGESEDTAEAGEGERSEA